MARSVDRNKPLSDYDRAYLESRGMDALIASIDDRFPGGAGGADEELPAYEDMTVEDLKLELGERNLAVTGKKDELVARLRQDDGRVL